MDLVRVQVIQSARCQSNLAKPCRGLLARRRENVDAPFHRDGAHARPIQPRAGCFGARAAAGAYPKLPFSTVAVHELGQLHEAYKHLRSSRHASCGRLKTLCGPLGSAVRYRGGRYVIGTVTERYRLGSGPQHPRFAAAGRSRAVKYSVRRDLQRKLQLYSCQRQRVADCSAQPRRRRVRA